MNSGLIGFCSGIEQCAQLIGDRVGEGDVRDDAATEESMFEGLFGVIDELVDEYNVAGFVAGLEGSDGADTNNPGDAGLFEGENIGAVIEFAGEDSMTAAVAREEDDLATGEFAEEQLIGGWSEGC